MVILILFLSRCTPAKFTGDIHLSSKTSLPSIEPNKTPFRRLFWYDEKNDVVKACETPSEQKRHTLGLAPIGSNECRHRSNHIFVPRRQLLFPNEKGNFYFYGMGMD